MRRYFNRFAILGNGGICVCVIRYHYLCAAISVYMVAVYTTSTHHLQLVLWPIIFVWTYETWHRFGDEILVTVSRGRTRATLVRGKDSLRNQRIATTIQRGQINIQGNGYAHYLEKRRKQVSINHQQPAKQVNKLPRKYYKYIRERRRTHMMRIVFQNDHPNLLKCRFRRWLGPSNRLGQFVPPIVCVLLKTDCIANPLTFNQKLIMYFFSAIPHYSHRIDWKL